MKNVQSPHESYDSDSLKNYMNHTQHGNVEIVKK
jgi:hypothetical protein